MLQIVESFASWFHLFCLFYWRMHTKYSIEFHEITTSEDYVFMFSMKWIVKSLIYILLFCVMQILQPTFQLFRRMYMINDDIVSWLLRRWLSNRFFIIFFFRWNVIVCYHKSNEIFSIHEKNEIRFNWLPEQHKARQRYM